jgi:hypothetical protein
MIIIGLNGKEYNWKPKSADTIDEHKSKLHLKIKKLLKEIYPFDIILEEVTLPGSSNLLKKKDLIADFYIPNRCLIVEAHGEQHYEYNSFFFKNKFQFLKAQKRDNDKIQWCNLNNIKIIALNFADSIETWRQQIEYRE